jgi:AAA+ ATPase superfamily predicted ATPase
VSNAFRKSKNVQNNFFPNERYSSISACKANIISWVEYPLRKPFWFSEIIPSLLEQILSLLFKMEVNNFPRHLIRVIARKLSGSLGHSLFLKIGFMTPQVQFSGIIPVFSTMLNNLQYILPKNGGECFKYSF